MSSTTSIRKVYRSFGCLCIDVDGQTYSLSSKQLGGAPRVEPGDVVEVQDSDRAPGRLTVHTRWMGGRSLPPVSWELVGRKGR